MPKLGDMASILRSKTAGPFLMAVDIIFDDPGAYAAVQRSGPIDKALFAQLYGLTEGEVQLNWYEPALAIKAAVPRNWPCGEIGDTDNTACQQAWMLYDIDVPAVPAFSSAEVA